MSPEDSPMPDGPLTVLLTAESAHGPTNNCIGIGTELLRMGHRVVFAAEESWEGKLAALGFEERLVAMAPPPPADEVTAAGQVWIDFIRDTAPHFRTPTIEQISTVIEPIWRQLLDAAVYAQPQYAAVVEEFAPDVIAQDNVSAFPALVSGSTPWVRLVSAQPLEMKGPGVPPTFSGLPAGDPSGWADYRAEYTRACTGVWADYDAFCRDQGAPGLPADEFIHEGAWNLYMYPAAIDYLDARPLNESWRRIQSSVRTTDAVVEVPDHILNGSGSLIYLSLGSLGGADVDLMKRLTGFLADSPHRFIVSKGPRADEYDLPDNMWGAGMVPQTTLIGQCDLVVTHGGNNTICEAFHFGKPTIVLPLFWDQYDNAQRVDELGLGRRLDTYRVERDELVGAVDELLGDGPLRARLAQIGEQVRAENGVQHAAATIAEVGRRHRAAG